MGLLDSLLILISNIVADSEEFLFFVWYRDQDGGGAWNKWKCTDDFFGRNLVKVGRVGFDLEVHDARGQMVHIETIDDLIVLVVAGRSDVNDFPVDGTGELSEALESDIEVERVHNTAGIVSNSDIVYMKLGHSIISRSLSII